MGKRPNKNSGFTLIELIIVLFIVSILASIAYPSYISSVIKNNRQLAISELQQLTLSMERDFSLENKYKDLISSNDFLVSKDVASNYSILISLSEEADSYTVIATPSGRQAKDKCGELQINSTLQTIAASDRCWN